MSVTVNINLPRGNYEFTTVETTTKEYVDFDPLTEEEEILQNVRTICSTPKNSVPLDREFGIDCDPLDAPTPAAIAKIQREIIHAIKKYEPRAKIEGVDLVNVNESQFSVNVEFSLRNAEE